MKFKLKIRGQPPINFNVISGPTIPAGTPEIGTAISASTIYDQTPDTLTYQWELEATLNANDWGTISGATSATYTPILAQFGKRLRRKEHAVYFGVVRDSTSNASDPVSAPLSISGTVPNFFKDQNISFTPTISGGTGTGRTVTLVQGTLLTGQSLNSSTGVINGTTTVVENSADVIIRVTDDGDNTADFGPFNLVCYESLLEANFTTGDTPESKSFTVVAANTIPSYVLNTTGMTRFNSNNASRVTNLGSFYEGTATQIAPRTNMPVAPGNQPWNPVNLTSYAAITDLAGGTAAVRLVTNGTSGTHNIESYYPNTPQGTGGIPMAHSWILRPSPSGGTPAQKVLFDYNDIGLGAGAKILLNLTDDSFTVNAYGSPLRSPEPDGTGTVRQTVEVLPGGWKRYTHFFVRNPNGANKTTLDLYICDNSGNQSHAVSGIALDVFSPQLFSGNTIPMPMENTGNTAITRPIDDHSKAINEPNVDYTIGGSVYHPFALNDSGLAPVSTVLNAWAGSDDNNRIHVEIDSSFKLHAFVTVSGASYELGRSDPLDLSQVHTWSVVREGTKFGFVVNGSVIRTKEVATNPDWTNIRLGNNRALTLPFNGFLQTLYLRNGAIPLTSSTTSNGLVVPHAAWNGTALDGLGGVAPTQPTEVNGHCPAFWCTDDHVYLHQDEYIGVDADEAAWVELFGDCETIRVTTRTWRTFQTADGRTVSRYRYWFQLDAQAWIDTNSAPGTEARIFARVHPLDSAKEEFIVGLLQATPSGFTGRWYNWPLYIYPRATRSDFDKTVRATGGDYTTISAAITAARSGTKEHPFLTLNPGETYSWGDITGGTGTANAKGRMVIYCPPGGARAIIQAPSAYDPETHADGRLWHLGWPGVEFRGAIKIDISNFTGMTVVDSRTHSSAYFNGIRIEGPANYSGLRPVMPWNSGPGQSFGVGNENGTDKAYPDHTDDCIVRNQGAFMTFQGRHQGIKSEWCYGSFHYGVPYVADCEYYNYITETMRLYAVGRTILTISGPSGWTVSIRSEGGHGLGAGIPYGDLKFKNNLGTQVGNTIILGHKPSEGPVSASDLVSYINAGTWDSGNNHGITATLVDNTFLGPRFPAPWIVTDAPIGSGTPYPFKVWSDNHTEGWFGSIYHGLYRNIKNIHGLMSTGILFCGNMQNVSFVNILADATPNSSPQTLLEDGPGVPLVLSGGQVPYESLFNVNGAFNGGKNLRVKHCYFDGQFSLFDTDNISYTDAYIYGNLFRNTNEIDSSITSSMMKGNIGLDVDNDSMPITTPVNIDTVTATYNAAYVSKGHDFTVNSSGILASNLIAPVEPYDIFGNQRNSGVDCVGPVANGYTANADFDFEGTI